MKNLKKIVSVLFSAILLFSATTTSSVAIDKLHFVIGGGAGGGWDGTARGTGEALTKAGMLKSASFENMSGGGGGKALAGLLSGETQIISTGLGELMGARDQVRIIGITAPSRVSDAPDAPTLKEQGYDVQFVNWRGFFGPPGMSNADRSAIAKMLGDVQKTPEWETVRARNAWVNIYNPEGKFVSFLEKQTQEMTALMKKLGVI